MRGVRVFLLITVLLSNLIAPARAAAQTAALPSGFREVTVFEGLTNPTNVRFSPDGRVFVAEKSGIIQVFENLTDTTPTVFADLRTNTHNYWDRGLLGMALDPNFPTNPFIYVFYTYDAPIGETAPRWGKVDSAYDDCPTPPGATTDGCLVSGRLSRLEAKGNVMTGMEHVLIEDWCQQFPNHTIGDLVFGADGALYASAGEGAGFSNTEYGQYGNTHAGNQLNPCGDPPGGVGAAMLAPTAEGGALRSQSLRRPAGEPVTLDGTVIRVDPATGLGLADNPLAGNSNVNAQRIIAYGFRNPFRMVARPGTNEIWIGDVGWYSWDEINRVTNPTDSVIENFGWPCYEGNARQSGYDSANLNICENLYQEGSRAITKPYYLYNHNDKVASNDTCPTGSSSIAGIAFQSGSGSNYPTEYNGALYLADYSRGCIWVMFQGANGDPDSKSIKTFLETTGNPVDIEMGPDGNLYFVDFNGGTIRRIEYFSKEQPPVAVASASPTNGETPLTVSFDSIGSHDPNPDNTLTFAWDLDGDGAFDDSTQPQPNYIYSKTGTYTAKLQVTNNRGVSSTSPPITISVGNTMPATVIETPVVGNTWKVGDVINFSGSATDAQDGALPASAFTWTMIMNHCPSNCHTHPIQTLTGVIGGSFTMPDHEYPFYVELQLTVTDSSGLSNTTSLQLNPRAVALTFQTQPNGLQITFNGVTQTTPFTVAVIAGSSNTVSAVSPPTNENSAYKFQSWSDGGAQTHTIIAPFSATAYTVRFKRYQLQQMI